MQSLFGLTLNQLKDVAAQVGLPSFAAKQMADWLYKKHATSIDDFSNISKSGREKLKLGYEVGLQPYLKVQQSVDGTRKYLFAALNNNFIETAMIPDDDRRTVCVSSQVGCKMGCHFCMTAKQGFQASLTATEILNQIRSIDEFEQVTNLVFMGMGEPFDNLAEVMSALEVLTSDWGYAMSPKRITVSTVGVIPGMMEFLHSSRCHLAVSLHNPIAAQRSQMMPVEKAYGIEQVVEQIRSYNFEPQRRVSFEYIMFDGLNDTPKHVSELVRLLNGIDCRVNLIHFHDIPNSPFRGSSDQRMQEFKDALNARGLLTTIRASRGQDIQAACGLLSTKELLEQKKG